MAKRLARGVVLKVLYPLLMFTGAFLPQKKESFQRFIINLNNRLVMREASKTGRILLLLPHCLQIDECKIRLTHDINNCARCGRCEIKDLISIAESHNLELFVATGGTIARRIVGEVRPQAIVAVACERDLSSGIADTYPLPTLGITNERPFGPCVNTQVNLEKVKDAIRRLSQHCK
ncbi:MAG: DUF116 domain-containing protein [Thermodesulfovibrionales bacterium]